MTESDMGPKQGSRTILVDGRERVGGLGSRKEEVDEVVMVLVARGEDGGGWGFGCESV